jgi:hypothetical protein
VLRWTLLLGCSIVIAQEVPPLPPLRGDAASLKDTMKFLEGKLPGKVNYVVYTHNNEKNIDSSVKRSFELSDVTANSDRCSISFHYHFENGPVTLNKDEEVPLKEVGTVTLKQMEQHVQQQVARIGHPEVSVRTEPQIYLVVVSWEPKHNMMFNFYDDALADRVLQAMQHAVQLCGGGSKEPF